MSAIQELSVKDIVLKSAVSDIEPFIKYLKMDFEFSPGQVRVEASQAEKIELYFREMGSNDFATFFRGEGVEYDEVLLDVGKKLKAKVKEGISCEENEAAIISKVFEDSLKEMSEDEKRELFKFLGAKEYAYDAAGPASILSAQILGNLGGFATYKISMIVANMVAKAILGQGLSFATNAAISRGIGVFLGPVGWIASGVWLAIDIAGPAFRKTVPAVIHMAMLRQLIKKKVTIGIVGEGAAGKDSLASAVFGLDTNIDPVAGSTAEAESYQLGENDNINIINYAGFNDIRDNVNQLTDEHLGHTDVFLWVLDVNRGITKADEATLQKLNTYNRPILACLNKVDLPRNEQDKIKLINNIHEKLDTKGVSQFIETAFDPDPRLFDEKIGCLDVYQWVTAELVKQGKDEDILPDFEAS